jgi:hypothetical protein
MAGEQIVVDGEIVESDSEEVETDDLEIAPEGDNDEDSVDDGAESDEDKGDDELWMSTDDKQPASDSMPVSTHIKTKQKLKARLSDKDDELAKLKEENAALKAGLKTSPKPKDLVRPQEDDFDTITEFQEALTDYEDQLIANRLEDAERRREIKSKQERAARDLEEQVDSHYERAAKLVKSSNLDPEIFKKTDLTIRETVENIMPKKGDLIVDQMISILGEGSEKVLFFLGRNPKALREFESLLETDSSGLKASVFLGVQKERLLNSKRKISAARAPATDVNGDDKPANSAKAKALLKKRQSALKKGNVQLAYNLKKQAKEQGVDVSNW